MASRQWKKAQYLYLWRFLVNKVKAAVGGQREKDTQKYFLCQLENIPESRPPLATHYNGYQLSELRRANLKLSTGLQLNFITWEHLFWPLVSVWAERHSLTEEVGKICLRRYPSLGMRVTPQLLVLRKWWCNIWHKCVDEDEHSLSFCSPPKSAHRSWFAGPSFDVWWHACRRRVIITHIIRSARASALNSPEGLLQYEWDLLCRNRVGLITLPVHRLEGAKKRERWEQHACSVCLVSCAKLVCLPTKI